MTSGADLGQLITQYAAGAATPRRWIAGLGPQQLTARPVAGTWSIQELVVHVLDSDLIATHRMRRVVAEIDPLLISYDETRFARYLCYDRTEPALVCELFDVNRRFTAAWLATLPESALALTGIHNQRGRVSLRQLIQAYIDHLVHHEAFLIAKRTALGNPPDR